MLKHSQWICVVDLFGGVCRAPNKDFPKWPISDHPVSSQTRVQGDCSCILSHCTYQDLRYLRNCSAPSAAWTACQSYINGHLRSNHQQLKVLYNMLVMMSVSRLWVLFAAICASSRIIASPGLPRRDECAKTITNATASLVLFCSYIPGRMLTMHT